MDTQSKKLDFTGQNIYAGLDVHLKSWKVTIMTDKLFHKTFSQPPTAETLHQYLVRNFPGANYYSAYEAGFCGYWIHNKLTALGIKSIVVNAADIPTTDKEKVQKEDARDSRKIAKALKNGDLSPIHIPSSKCLDDRTLVRMRATLVKDLSRYKNRVKSFLYFYGIPIPTSFGNQTKWSQPFTSWLENVAVQELRNKGSLEAIVTAAKNLRNGILIITKQINELSKTDDYRENVKLLRSIPGIGLLTAMLLLTELETILRFENIDKVCGYVGLVPSTQSSGDKELVGQLTPRGHSFLRSSIIESAWVAVRLDPALMKNYHQYCMRMEPNKAIIRIAKKLVSRIRFVLKNKQTYVSCIVK